MSGVFDTLPTTFFSPLAGRNRLHYARCLLIFYRLFQESRTGVERSSLMGRYAEYMAEAGRAWSDDATDEAGPLDEPEPEAPGHRGSDPSRSMAGLALRRLIACGWMGEETLPDYTRLVTICGHAKPFFEALARVEEGLSAEYEGHVVAVYSSLCGDAAKESGHLAVLTAHDHAMRLVEALKVLSQNMRAHYQQLLDAGKDAEIRDILRLHYDRYIEDVVDKAYARLKTSENLSRYRPRIVKVANAFLRDNAWLERTSRSLAALRGGAIKDAHIALKAMLEEIRDQLRAVDPLLDEIDKRNMLYARSSVEHIKARVRADGGLTGRLDAVARAFASDKRLSAKLRHRLHHLVWTGKESRYKRWFRSEANFQADESPLTDTAELERAEAELRLRIANQLSPERITAWLDEHIRRGELGWAHELAVNTEDFIRVVHAAAYGDARPGRFPYTVEQSEGRVRAAGWEFAKHGFRRKRE